ncbi:MAG TPA: DUF2007 domain-containing protein [Candidatus Sulfotelmatobacter sp.]|jgi:hypothetical protein
MTQIDPAQERARLVEAYSHQTDEELEAIARQSDGLTDIAIQALRTELSTRGLTQDLLDEEPDSRRPEPEFRDLTVVRSYWNLLEAQLAKGALDAAGIECFLFDDNMIRMDWFNANAIGGVKLRVDPENVDAANRILDECAANVAATDEPADSADLES